MTPRLPTPLWTLSPRWEDVLLAAAAVVVVVSSISVASEPGARDVDAVAYAMGVLIGAAFLFRRRSPVGVLVVVFALGFLYVSVDYPAGPHLPAMWAALYFAAAAGRRFVALGFGLVSGGGAYAYRAIVEGHGLIEMSMLAEIAIPVAVIMLGDSVHSRRLWMQEVHARLERAEQDREAEAQRRVGQERLRIAHELHDVLAHTLAVVSVQAGVARDLLEDDPAASRAALDEMRAASREAMTELRATVGVLRDGAPPPRAPVPGLRDLDRLVDSARQAGVEVRQAVEGDPRPLPSPVDLAAFRVLQEAITNIVKHAPGGGAQVVVGYAPTGIQLEVTSEGACSASSPALPGGGPSAAAGYGIPGMQERVEALGGRFEAGPAGDRFVVRAWLPLEIR